MKLFFLKLELISYLSIFLLDFSFIQIKKTKILFFIFLITPLIIGLIAFNSTNILLDHTNNILFNTTNILFKNKNYKTISNYSPTPLNLYQKTKKTKSSIQNEIYFWESIIKKQPNSRDALINLSILKRMLNQNNEADFLWNKAKSIDPNNKIFTKN